MSRFCVLSVLLNIIETTLANIREIIVCALSMFTLVSFDRYRRVPQHFAVQYLFKSALLNFSYIYVNKDTFLKLKHIDTI